MRWKRNSDDGCPPDGVHVPYPTDGRRPQASWVMGRSARWHSAEGRALLAEDPLAEDAKQLSLYLSARPFLGPPSLPTALNMAARLLRLVRNRD